MTALNSTTPDEIITVNKQALIHAAMELEKQEAYRHFELEAYIEALEALVDKLRDFLTFDRASSVRARLLNQLLPDKVWSKLLSDELLEQWESEWKAEFERKAEASTDHQREDMHLF